MLGSYTSPGGGTVITSGSTDWAEFTWADPGQPLAATGTFGPRTGTAIEKVSVRGMWQV